MCSPFAGIIVEDPTLLPVDGSVVFAMVQPAAGLRAHSSALLVARRPVVFVGGSTSDNYYDEATSSTVILPSGWVQFGMPV